MLSNTHFKPLPDYLKVEDSDIEGQGLIAQGYIPEGTVVGLSHIEEDPSMFHAGLARTAIGSFLNHSPNPNCVLIAGEKYWHLWTSQDIFIGDELCVDYNLYRCGMGFI